MQKFRSAAGFSPIEMRVLSAISGIGIVAAALALFLVGEVRAQGDLDLLTTYSVPPNVMLVLDNSGSMRTSFQGSTRIEVAGDTLVDFINDTLPDGKSEQARLGFTIFEPSDFHNGGLVLVPIGSNNKQALIDGVNNTVTAVLNFGNAKGTMLGETLVDIGRYFAGQHGFGSYPAVTNTSPIDGSCRKNFAVFMTDGEPYNDLNNHYGSPVAGTTAYSTFLDTIGNADGDANECSLSAPAVCVDAPSSGRDDGRTYNNNGTDWFDDVAYYLSRTDLNPTLDETQNLVTYTIGFTIDHPLLQETADNGSGRYFTTSDGDLLAAQLRSTIREIIERSTYFSASSVPTSRTAFGDGFYTAFFKPKDKDSFWPGHLQAYRLSPDLEVLDKNGNLALDPATNQFKEPRAPFWDAQTELSDGAHPPRSLYTTESAVQTDFNETNITAADLALTAAEINLYPNDPNVPFADVEALADAMVDYLRGEDAFDKDRDGDTSELREFVLGDIFHSSTISIGPPSIFLSGEGGYGPAHDASSFLGQYGHRSRILYVGANDGMLHAFDGGRYYSGDNPGTSETEDGYYDLGSGEEAFGYVPGFLLDKLKYIPRNLPRQYYYVDGSPSAADVWLPSSPSDPSKEAGEWATVLVTGMRQGGSGYLALDVTDPDAAGGPHGPYPKLLWEVDESDAPLGETWSEPVITRVKIKAGLADLCGFDDSDDGACREQWVAIFGGGYRKDGDPNLSSYVSDPNNAAWTNMSKGIFMVAMDTGQLIGQVLFDPDPSEVLNKMRFSIPSTPAVLDLDFDGFSDVVYVGDLGGQMWRWDISKVGEDNTLGDGIMDNWPMGLLFKSDPAALGAGGLHYHSIFFPPVATYLNGQLVLAFGSGERTDLSYEGDPTADDNNRFWVVWDRIRLGVEPTDPNSGWLTLGEGHVTVDGKTRGLNDVSNLATDLDPDDDGYYIVVPDGEKFITNPVLYGGVLLTLTYLPVRSSTDVCKRFRNTNIWVFNLEDTGGLIDETAPAGNAQRNRYLGPGVPTDPSITISEDRVVLIGQTSFGNIFEFDVPVTPPPPVELIFWRQLY